MKIVKIILDMAFLFCISLSAQNAIMSGGFYQTISDGSGIDPASSQVSSLGVNTAQHSWGFDTFDNLVGAEPIFLRGGSNPAITWTYKAGPVVRGHVYYGSGGSTNFPFASVNNSDQSTELIFTFQPHTIPKLRPANNQFVINVDFTVTGRLSIFASPGSSDSPYRTENVFGRGSGYVIYRRRSNQYNVQAWRRSPQASLVLSTISLNFTEPAS